MKKVIIPWHAGGYSMINGNHPLLASFVENAPEGIDFINVDNQSAFSANEMHSVFQSQIEDGIVLQKSPCHNQVDGEFLKTLVTWADQILQARIEALSGEDTVVFHHTALICGGKAPFVLHLESLTTLLQPFLFHGRTWGVTENGNCWFVDLKALPIYWLVRHRLESPQCKTIFTHMRRTFIDLIRCFDSSIITSKLKYIPLGVEVTPSVDQRVQEKIKNIPQRKGLNVLFTNSRHEFTESFILRGGVELLIAFQKLLEVEPNAKLTILSTRPQMDVIDAFDSPNIVWMDQGISDEQLYELLLDADVFSLVSVGLHSYSLLRALKCGAVLLCSDVPGYEEYVVHEQTAIVIPGKKKNIYLENPDNGWMMDSYHLAYGVDGSVVSGLVDALLRLAADPLYRQRIAAAARDHVDQNYNIRPWVEGIRDLFE